MSLNRLVGRAVIIGVLVACGSCIVLAGEPGVETRPQLREISREETTSVTLPGGAPTDPALFREWSNYQIQLRRLELDQQREAHRQQIDRERMERERQRDQQRYEYQQMRSASRYSRTYGGYGGSYYPIYTPPVPVPVYDPYLSGGYGGYAHRRAYHPGRSYRSRYRDYGHDHCHGPHFGVHIGF